MAQKTKPKKKQARIKNFPSKRTAAAQKTAAKRKRARWTKEDEAAAQRNTTAAIESAKAPEAPPTPVTPVPVGSSEKTTGSNTKLPGNFETSIKPFQWAKGVSGNPSGKRKTPITDAYRQIMGMEVPPSARKTISKIIGMVLPEGSTFAQAMAMNVALVAACTTKEAARAAMEVTNRVEGKVPQPITGGKGGPVEVTLTNEERRERIAQIIGKAKRRA